MGVLCACVLLLVLVLLLGVTEGGVDISEHRPGGLVRGAADHDAVYAFAKVGDGLVQRKHPAVQRKL